MNSLPFRARLLTLVVVLSNVLGNMALSLGMKAQVLTGIGGYLKIFINPFVVTGIILLIVWMLSRMTLMSWADLSYVLPVTSAGYVLSAVASRVFLAEQISVLRWTGTLLIFAGILLVSQTAPKTPKRI